MYFSTGSKHHYMTFSRLIVVCIALTCFNTFAQTIDEYFAEDETVRKDPWGYYQLLVNENNSDSLDKSNDEALLFLLRKAQTEYLLNYFSKFRKTIQETQQYLRDNSPIAIKCRLNIYSGIAARINSQYKESEQYLQVALLQAKTENLQRMRVFAKQELAYTHAIHERYDVSLKDLQEAYVAAFALSDDYLIAIINETYGAIYGYMNEHERSIEYYQKARMSYERLEYPAHISNALFGIASTYRYWKKYTEAIQYFDRYNTQTLYAPDMPPSFYGIYGLAMTLAEKGDCIEALSSIKTALSLPGIDDYDTELYKSKARCLIQLNQLPEAEKALNESKRIFESLPEVKGTKWFVELMKIDSELAFAQGNKDKAYQLLTQYYEKHIEIIQSNASATLIQTQALMGMEQRNVELNLLQQRSKVQDLLITQQDQQNQQLIYLVVFGICLIIIVLGALLFQRKYSDKLFTLSIKDSLTGLYNRHYTFESLSKLIDSRVSVDQPMSVLILDIDNFKEINDTYGHPFGDHVIQTLAQITQTTLRAEDVLGRIGGEEFFCVLPLITEQQSYDIAHRIVQNIFQHVFITKNNQKVRISVSIGVSLVTDNTTNADILYSQADQALYESKRLGKNRVTIFNHMLSPLTPE